MYWGAPWLGLAKGSSFYAAQLDASYTKWAAKSCCAFVSPDILKAPSACLPDFLYYIDDSPTAQRISDISTRIVVNTLKPVNAHDTT